MIQDGEVGGDEIARRGGRDHEPEHPARPDGDGRVRHARRAGLALLRAGAAGAGAGRVRGADASGEGPVQQRGQLPRRPAAGTPRGRADQPGGGDAHGVGAGHLHDGRRRRDGRAQVRRAREPDGAAVGLGDRRRRDPLDRLREPARGRGDEDQGPALLPGHPPHAPGRGRPQPQAPGHGHHAHRLLHGGPRPCSSSTSATRGPTSSAAAASGS